MRYYVVNNVDFQSIDTVRVCQTRTPSGKVSLDHVQRAIDLAKSKMMVALIEDGDCMICDEYDETALTGQDIIDYVNDWNETLSEKPLTAVWEMKLFIDHAGNLYSVEEMARIFDSCHSVWAEWEV